MQENPDGGAEGMEDEAGFIAYSDQMSAACRDIINDLMKLSTTAAQEYKDTGQKPDPEAYMNAVFEILDRLEHPTEFASLIMYAVRLLTIQARTNMRNHALGLTLLKACALIIHPEHPLAILADENSHSDLEVLVKAGYLDLKGETDTFVTGTGQQLGGVHSREHCEEQFCVVHNPCPGPWSQWPTHWRGDQPFDVWRGFERICPCGVGHPAVEEYLRNRGDAIAHGCCGQCPCGPWACDEIRQDGKLLGYMAKKEPQ